MDKFQPEIVHKMLEQDAFSQWLGVKIVELRAESVKLEMIVRAEMLNGFQIAHGGISYSLADSALAFASNIEGFHAVSIDTSIKHLKKLSSGDVLRAFAQKVSRSRKIGHYSVEIVNQSDEIVAVFNGTVYISDKKWEI